MNMHARTYIYACIHAYIKFIYDAIYLCINTFKNHECYMYACMLTYALCILTCMHHVFISTGIPVCIQTSVYDVLTLESKHIFLYPCMYIAYIYRHESMHASMFFLHTCIRGSLYMHAHALIHIQHSVRLIFMSGTNYTCLTCPWYPTHMLNVSLVPVIHA